MHNWCALLKAALSVRVLSLCLKHRLAVTCTPWCWPQNEMFCSFQSLKECSWALGRSMKNHYSFLRCMGGGGHLENTQGKGYFHVYCINWITRMRIWSGIWIAFCYCEGLIAKWPMVNLILFYLLNPTAYACNIHTFTKDLITLLFVLIYLFLRALVAALARHMKRNIKQLKTTDPIFQSFQWFMTPKDYCINIKHHW